MTAKLKEVTTAENASKMPQHIYDTFIVGAGISGLAAAKRLDDVGYENYKIIEKATRVGGTWRENTYPGCGCDVPSALYSYSFAPSSKWSHLFARQPEILSYLEEVSQTFHIDQKLNLELSSLKPAGTPNKIFGYWKLQKEPICHVQLFLQQARLPKHKFQS